MSPGPALRPGLCSVTFRGLGRAEVVEAAADAGLTAVEWGGDVHVPHGDVVAAADAAARSADAGLEIVSYGSYLFLGSGGAAEIDPVLNTARALGAPGVRVWCPPGVEPGAGDDERVEVVRAAATLCGAAADHGLTVTLEFHGGTLTATAASTVALLDEVGAPNLFTAWQVPYWAPAPDAAELSDIAALAPRLSHVHVYEWDPDHTRHPLARGADRWPARLVEATASGAAAVAAGVPRAALVEFVPGDDPGRLAAEAATLRGWLATC